MTKNLLTITMLAAMFLTSCNDSLKQEISESATESTTDEIESISSFDKDGKELKLSFNNEKGTSILIFNGETIELVAEKSASGIWYRNDQYELRGKGNDLELKKDGRVVFMHQDDIVHYSLKNKEGQTLDMTFNNTENTVKAYLDGGDQIDLEGEKAASGIWYKNDHYELRGKGDDLELTKDGVTVFEN